ncbi:MAG TPA: hypothetical protein VF190_11500 [Rhodothermales bacterium]
MTTRIAVLDGNFFSRRAIVSGSAAGSTGVYPLSSSPAESFLSHELIDAA